MAPTMYRDKVSDYRDDIDEELYLEKRLENHDFRMKKIYDKELGWIKHNKNKNKGYHRNIIIDWYAVLQHGLFICTLL